MAISTELVSTPLAINTYQFTGKSNLASVMTIHPEGKVGNPAPENLTIAGNRWKQLTMTILGGDTQAAQDLRTDSVLVFRSQTASTLDLTTTSGNLVKGQVVQNWTLLGAIALPQTQLDLVDSGLASGSRYYYTLVPYANVNSVYHYAPSSASALDSTWKLFVKASIDTVYFTSDDEVRGYKAILNIRTTAASTFTTVATNTVTYIDHGQGILVPTYVKGNSTQARIASTDSVKITFTIGEGMGGDVIFAAHPWFVFQAEKLFTSTLANTFATLFSKAGWSAGTDVGSAYTPEWVKSPVLVPVASKPNQISLWAINSPGG